MPLWARPAAAAGAPDTARQARFRKAVCVGRERGPGLPWRAWLPLTGASHARPPPRTSWPCGAGLARGGGPWRGVRDGVGARRSATRRDPGECCSRPDCGAPGRPREPGPWGGRRWARGVFAGRREEPGRRALAGARAKTPGRLRVSPRAAPFKARRPLGFLLPPVPRGPPSSPRRLQPRRQTPRRLRGAWHVHVRSWGLAGAACQVIAAFPGGAALAERQGGSPLLRAALPTGSRGPGSRAGCPARPGKG